MLIHWLIPGTYKVVEDLLISDMASIRMRAGLVGKYAPDINIKFSAGDQIVTKADVVVIGKIGGDCQNGRDVFWLKQLSEAKKYSKKIILDYTDHHLGSASSSMGNFYKNVLPLTDEAVVSSTLLCQLLTQFFYKEITVIEDPLEIQTIPPRMSIALDDITLLWFGHASNTSYLLNYLANDFLCDVGFKLIVLSNASGLQMMQSHQQSIRSNIRLNLTVWSLQNMIQASKFSQGCLIPSNLSDSRKSGASSNRLITAFALGLPVSADMLDSYSPFTDYFQNIREAPLSEFIKKIDIYVKKIHLAQKNVVPMFSQEVLLQKWRSLLL
jgi:hypothetical protein